MPEASHSRSIFISYRRDDSGGEAGRLFDDLIRAYGADTVFMDVSGIEPGVDFRKAIDANVTECGVLLAVIGRQWLTVTDSHGVPRLNSSNDFVGLEISTALARGIPVIPVLVHGATMPAVDDLPEKLKDLAFRNGVELTLARWNSDVALLTSALKSYVHVTPATASQTVHADLPVQLPAPAPSATAPSASKQPERRWFVSATALTLGLVAAGTFFFLKRPGPPAQSPASPVPISIAAPQPGDQIASGASEPANSSPAVQPKPDSKTAASNPGADKPTERSSNQNLEPAPKVSIVAPSGLAAPGATSQLQVPLPYNQIGIYSVGAVMPAGAGIDSLGHAYSPFEDFVAHGQTLRNGATFMLGPPDLPDFVRGSQPPLVLKLTGQRYSKVCILATAEGGNQHSQVFTVRYNGPAPNEHKFVQDMSDWAKTEQPRFAGETLLIKKAQRSRLDGTFQNTRAGLFEYEFPLDRSKGVQSLTLPPNKLIAIFAVTLVP